MIDQKAAVPGFYLPPYQRQDIFFRAAAACIIDQVQDLHPRRLHFE